MILVFEDESEAWFGEVISDHLEEAQARAFSIIEAARKEDNGCLTTATVRPSKLRFLGRQVEAYRFIYCVVNQVTASTQQVVRHRCHNRLCVNPDHLVLGSQADNKQDDWLHWAYGTDPDYL
ncbi:hypothetical protein GCM10011363_00050 [Marivita lacus]|uniref:Zinc-binding loop region of homing endonuclease domain-containing protein n=1 Tax=Marivita lacus TaxID=1323742 RepID=A0ABQ1K6T7_9RHOB|nr:HNH endonuclease [Marivita lacus]GGB87410.1 hypothetical protein GCM10011363_00050 [Marivita lacus]